MPAGSAGVIAPVPDVTAPAATNVTVENATTILATAPSGGAGTTVAVTVTNPDTQSGAANSAYTYNPLPAPVVTSNRSSGSRSTS